MRTALFLTLLLELLVSKQVINKLAILLYWLAAML
jgi:hypothetical protein